MFLSKGVPADKIYATCKMDDRCEVFGGPWLVDFVRKSGDPGDAINEWQAKYGRFDFALTRTGTPFDGWFSTSPQWEAVKVTPTATFYKRRAPQQ